jgi:hypothetical protein
MATPNKIKKKLQSIQNKYLKIRLDFPNHTSSKFVHQTLKFEKLDKRLAILTRNFLNKAKQNNPSIQPIIDLFNRSTIRVPKWKRSILARIDSLTLTPRLSTTQYI